MDLIRVNAFLKGILTIFDLPLISSTTYMSDMYTTALKLYSLQPAWSMDRNNGFKKYHYIISLFMFSGACANIYN